MKGFIRQSTDFAAYVALRVSIGVIQAAPLGFCDEAASALATLCSRILGLRRGVLRGNLECAFPGIERREVERLAWLMWRHLFLMVAEIAHTPRKVHRTTWRQQFDIPKVAQISRMLMHEGPKVVISGHFGNFELGGYLLGMFGFPTHTVARTLDNQYIDRFLNEFRGRTGQHILPKSGSRVAIEQLMESGGALTLLGDQAAGPKGCWVDFFGRPASTHKAVALFTLSYSAPTMIVCTRRLDSPLRYHIELQDTLYPLDDRRPLGTTQAVTQWFTDGLEACIRTAPEQYWWVHRRWKGKPPERALRRMRRAAGAA